MVVHGGGVTPATQTFDTDLSKPMRAEYCALEAAYLVEQMRAGVTTPKASPDECIDIMYTALSDVRLHVEAAEGVQQDGGERQTRRRRRLDECTRSRRVLDGVRCSGEAENWRLRLFGKRRELGVSAGATRTCAV